MTTVRRKNHRILIIDDNAAIHDDFRKILAPVSVPGDVELDAWEKSIFGMTEQQCEVARFEVDSALQGKDGVEMLQKAKTEGLPYAMAFVDMRMPPGWNGVETIAALWKIDPRLQVVLCTAYSDYSWDEMMIQLGRSDRLLILKKPFDNIEALQLADALTEKWTMGVEAARHVEHLDELVNERTADLYLSNQKLVREIEEHRRSEERFTKAFLGSPVPMAIINYSGPKIGDVNDAFVTNFGFGREELNGSQLWQSGLFDLGQSEALKEAIEKGQQMRDSSMEMKTKLGTARRVLVSLERIDTEVDSQGLLLVQDVTERESLERQLRQAQKMEAVGQLAAGVAHDFNNLLTIIQGYSSGPLDEPGLDKDLRMAFQEIFAASERAASLTYRLLSLSRGDLERSTILDLNEIVAGMRGMLRRVLGEHISQRYGCAEELPNFKGDAGNIEQVVLNLAVNARDAMPNGGSLEFSTAKVTLSADDLVKRPQAREGEFVCLSVADTGDGIDQAVLDRIFDPFFTTKEVGKGTGLGLAMVYGIMRQHRGWVEVESAVDQGTCFRLYFPATHEVISRGMDEPSNVPVALSGDETLFVVEDEFEVRRVLRSALEGAGYHVLEAANAEEALSIWSQHAQSIDLLLTDVMMPGGVSGRALAAQLRQQKPDLGVVYSSGYCAEALGGDFLSGPDVEFLPKPYRSTVLLKTVRKCLEGRRVLESEAKK